MNLSIKISLTILGTLLCHCAFSQQQNEDELKFDEDWAQVKVYRPLFIDGNNVKNDVGKNISYSLLIFPFTPALPPGWFFFSSVQNKIDGRSGGYIYNMPVKRIFQILYGKKLWYDTIAHVTHVADDLPSSQVMFKDVDSTGLVYLLNREKIKRNLYTVQMTSSADLDENYRRKQMITVVENQFGLDTYFKKVWKKCVVLSANDKPIPAYSSGNIELKLGNATGKGRISLNNVSMDTFIGYIANHFIDTDYPIINETGFDKHLGKISFLTSEPKLTFENIGRNLEQFGIKLTIEDRLVNMLVITKAK